MISHLIYDILFFIWHVVLVCVRVPCGILGFVLPIFILENLLPNKSAVEGFSIILSRGNCFCLSLVLMTTVVRFMGTTRN